MYLGIDGGGTNCRARIVDPEGRIRGRGLAGSANITTDPEGTIEAIVAAARLAVADGGLEPGEISNLHAGCGLAGAGLDPAVDARVAASLPFSSARIVLDAQAACLGAHGGEDGAILIIGTGSIGIALEQGQWRNVGGWGFALSDWGSGAHFGRTLLRHTLAAHEDLLPSSALTRHMMAKFSDDPREMVLWAKRAEPRDYAAFAPVIFDFAAQGDEVALGLISRSAEAVDRMADRLIGTSDLSLCLVGGLGEPLRPFLPVSVSSRLRDIKGDALDGAVEIARKALDGGAVS